MNWREQWIQYWCKHHWHRKESGANVNAIDPKVCKKNEQTYYRWACCKCELKKLFYFSYNPNVKDIGGSVWV